MCSDRLAEKTKRAPRRHSKQTAAGLAAGEKHQQELSYSSQPCWIGVYYSVPERSKLVTFVEYC